jgi:single-stranded-DNA-specific exonuclease
MASRAWKPGRQRWEIAPTFDAAADLARKIGSAPLVAQVLHNRGIDSPAAAKAFLNPKLTDLHDPSLLDGAELAARRIAQAVRDGRKIVLYGDYDVDGITGLAILYAVLQLVGIKPGCLDFYVPHRLEEGYGVNLEAVRKVVADGANLLVTVDCGISAAEPLAEASAAGVDVIVTDHHTPPEVLPAGTIVHPSLPGSAYPNPDLSGSGVAFKLAWQIAREVCGNHRVDPPMREFLLDATCLAALGTIADVVPLVGENRSLAVHGLRGLPTSKLPGLVALLESAGLSDSKLDAYHVGFILAPRLNACGRMGHARLAVELLTTARPQRCREIAEYLAKQNAARQKVEQEITEQASEMVRAGGQDAVDCRAIVLASDQWHGGVIGIVASRLVEEFGRPAVLIAVNGDGNGQGSGRSIRGFHMHSALAACSTHLVSFGGHAMAGGIRIRRDDVPAFTAAMQQYAAANIRPEQLRPELRIDAQTTLPALGCAVVEHLSRLAPFGQGNPPPVVAIRGCRLVVPPRRMGRTGQTVSLVLAQNDTTLRAVGFNMGDLADSLVGINTVDVAAEPVLNTFNGMTSVELKLRDVVWGT